jgi:hypothetical protein
MPIAYTRRKIEHLRKQPEHVRLRAASIMTAVSGVALVTIWLTILLPLQLHFSKPAEEDTAPVATQQAIAPTLLPSSAVSGAQDRVVDTQIGSPLPSSTPVATILTSPQVQP